VASFLLIAAILTTSTILLTTLKAAEAKLVPVEEHWKYHVNWVWDEKLFRNIGIITPHVVIQNETADRLEGYVADQNGTRISVYDGEQYTMVRYAYDGGFVSKWERGNKIYGGYITIDIPEQYRDADVVGIYVGNHHYTVDDGTLYNSQSLVFINSARLDYRTNSTLDNPVTEISEQPAQQVPTSPSIGGSLIDWILFQNGLFPFSSLVGSSDSGK
jgi:hypothetical protein